MPYWVYILACYKGRDMRCFYTGQTNNLRARLEEHNNNVRNGITDHFTGRFDFVRCLWSRKCETRNEAMSLERRIKELTPPEKWALIKRRVKI